MPKTCEYCKATNPDDALFCADCGTRLTATSQPEKDSWLSKVWKWLLEQFWEEELGLWVNIIRGSCLLILYISMGVGVLAIIVYFIGIVRVILPHLLT